MHTKPITPRHSRRSFALGAVLAPLLGLTATPAHSATLTILNPSFETDTAAVLGATGWTITTGGTSDWSTTTAGKPDSIIDPAAAAVGSNWLTANRLAIGAGNGTSADPAKIVQLIDVSADSALVDLGTATVTLNFMFADNDPADNAYVNITFYSDVAGTAPIGTSLTTGIITPTETDGTSRAPWAARELSGLMPSLARSLMIEIVNDRTSGSAGNTHFDAFSGAITVPEPSTALLGLFGVLGLLRRRR